jgi:hypothetical protein
MRQLLTTNPSMASPQTARFNEFDAIVTASALARPPRRRQPPATGTD